MVSNMESKDYRVVSMSLTSYLSGLSFESISCPSHKVPQTDSSACQRVQYIFELVGRFGVHDVRHRWLGNMKSVEGVRAVEFDMEYRVHWLVEFGGGKSQVVDHLGQPLA